MAVIVALQVAVGRASGAENRPDIEMNGVVVHEAGTPLENVTVFAVESRSHAILASDRTNHKGEVTLLIPAGHQVLLGAAAPRFELLRFEGTAANQFRLTMRVLPMGLHSIDTSATPGPAVPPVGEVSVSPEPPRPQMKLPLGMLRGSVRDETGAALAGVRVSVYSDTTSTLVATTLSDATGHFMLATPPGHYKLQSFAPGLKPERYEVGPRGDSVIAMSIDVKPETIQIVDGEKVLSFRLEDSIDPVYYPPPQAKAWLKFRFCLDVDQMLRRASSFRPTGPRVRQPTDGSIFPRGDSPSTVNPVGDVPLSYAVRQLKLAPYWWLKKLYTAPPGTCRPPRPRIGALPPL